MKIVNKINKIIEINKINEINYIHIDVKWIGIDLIIGVKYILYGEYLINNERFDRKRDREMYINI